EARIASMEAQLAGTRADLEQQARAAETRATQAEAELAAARAELAARPETPTPVDASEQISAIIQASERAATRIIDVAGQAHQEQVEQLDRMRAQVREEADRMVSWREQLGPIVHSIRSSIDRARARIDDIPDRIREALNPLGEAIDSVNDQLTSLVEEVAEPATSEDERGPGGAEDDDRSEPERPDDSSAPIRAIRLDEPEAARTGDATDDPGTHPGWHRR
ncbi:MAG TPA: hypothetical protein VF058_03525, partial [Actinomycetota bacterium]